MLDGRRAFTSGMLSLRDRRSRIRRQLTSLAAPFLVRSRQEEPPPGHHGSGWRGQCQGEATEDEVHVGLGRCPITGLGDVEGCLAHGPDEDVGQGLDGLRRGEPRSTPSWRMAAMSPTVWRRYICPPPVPGQDRRAVVISANRVCAVRSPWVRRAVAPRTAAEPSKPWL
jgi:hypothetical protein